MALLIVASSDSQAAERIKLVPEGTPRYSFDDGVLEMRGGGGSLRISSLYLDFRLSFEFSAATSNVDAGVLIRTWTGVGGWPGTGYRVKLPIDSTTAPSALLAGYKRPVTVTDSGRLVLNPAGEWQQVEIIAEGPRITYLLNGTRAAVFEIGTYGGHVFFDTRRGLVRLRNIIITSTERPIELPADAMTGEGLKAAGGQIAKLIREVRPGYTREAMRRLVQGRVHLEIVVLPDGSPGAVRVIRSLDPDLDLSAIAAVRAWKFKPAMLGGKPVPMLAEVEMTFTLK